MGVNMKRHLGSSLGILFGILAIIAGITQPGGILIAGIVMTIGGLAYRSAKKRKLDEVKNTILRKTLEGAGIVGIIVLITLQNDLKQLVVTDPVPNFIIPVFAVAAYIIVLFKKKILNDELPE